MPPVQNNIYYNSFRDCTMAGYEESLKILKAFSIQEFEEKNSTQNVSLTVILCLVYMYYVFNQIHICYFFLQK